MEWVNVKEGLPEKDLHVLIFTPYCKPKYTVGYYNGSIWEQRVFNFDNKINYKCIVMNVELWMPLPEPPKV